MKLFYAFAALFCLSLSLTGQAALLNEVNYIANDPDGHGIEVVAAAGEDLDGWSLAVYTAGGVLSQVLDLSNAVVPAQQNGYGTVWYDVVQNDGGGGAALIDPTGAVSDFISYGTSSAFTASDGPAAGQTANYLGDSPTGVIGLTGSSFGLDNFNWAILALSSPGSINTDQVFIALMSREPAKATGNARVYPNPFAGEINVQLADLPGQNFEISLYDLRGVRLMNNQFTAQTANVNLRIDNLPAGTYLLRYSDGASAWTRTLLHQ